MNQVPRVAFFPCLWEILIKIEGAEPPKLVGDAHVTPEPNGRAGIMLVMHIPTDMRSVKMALLFVVLILGIPNFKRVLFLALLWFIPTHSYVVILMSKN